VGEQRPSIETRSLELVNLLVHLGKFQEEHASKHLKLLEAKRNRRYVWFYTRMIGEDDLEKAMRYFTAKYSLTSQCEYPAFRSYDYWLAPSPLRAYMRRRLGVIRYESIRMGAIYVHRDLKALLHSLSFVSEDESKLSYRIEVLDAIQNAVGDSSIMCMFDSTIFFDTNAKYKLPYGVLASFLRTLEKRGVLKKLRNGNSWNTPALYRVLDQKLLCAVKELLAEIYKEVKDGRERGNIAAAAIR